MRLGRIFDISNLFQAPGQSPNILADWIMWTKRWDSPSAFLTADRTVRALSIAAGGAQVNNALLYTVPAGMNFHLCGISAIASAAPNCTVSFSIDASVAGVVCVLAPWTTITNTKQTVIPTEHLLFLANSRLFGWYDNVGAGMNITYSWFGFEVPEGADISH